MFKRVKLAAIIFIFTIGKANSQFYYSDILINKVANNNYINYKNNKVKKIIGSNATVNSNNEKEGITVQQYFTNNWGTLTTETNLSVGIKTSSTTTFVNNKIIKKEEEGKNVNSIVSYEYDNAGKLTGIYTSSDDTSVNKGFNEKHIWTYDAKLQPSKMLKIKNNTDTTMVEFLKDEQNNIAEERWTKKGELIETYYYYYNEKNLLTDVVKFNMKVGKMLPEFLFDYDTNNNLVQMTQIPFGSDNYNIWKYYYNQNGLKEKENCYSKKGEIIGKMEYSYSY